MRWACWAYIHLWAIERSNRRTFAMCGPRRNGKSVEALLRVWRAIEFSFFIRREVIASLASRGRSPVSRAGSCRRTSVAVGLAATGPDEREALAAYLVEEVGVDRGGEARIVQLDRDVVAAFGRALGPSGANLDVMRCTALRRLCVARDYAESCAVSGGFPGLWRRYRYA